MPWFGTMSHSDACMATGDVYTVPYTCEDSREICCTVSSCVDPTMNTFGTCLKVMKCLWVVSFAPWLSLIIVLLLVCAEQRWWRSSYSYNLRTDYISKHAIYWSTHDNVSECTKYVGSSCVNLKGIADEMDSASVSVSLWLLQKFWTFLVWTIVRRAFSGRHLDRYHQRHDFNGKIPLVWIVLAFTLDRSCVAYLISLSRYLRFVQEPTELDFTDDMTLSEPTTEADLLINDVTSTVS